ncbi:MAG: hypothetical protein E7161_01255 [Firmicutes bacterium]|nr:hypothetical protein [Bacillota bacterium]
MKDSQEIKYLSKSRDSIFASLDIRENPDDAFDNAIKRGMKRPEDWMYMYSKNNRDYFKNCDTREFRSYPQFGPIAMLKKKFEHER